MSLTYMYIILKGFFKKFDFYDSTNEIVSHQKKHLSSDKTQDVFFRREDMGLFKSFIIEP